MKTLRIATIIALAAAGLALAFCSDNTGTSDGGTDAVGSDTLSPDVGIPAITTDEELLSACIRHSACGIQSYPILYNCVRAYYTIHKPQGMSQIYDKIYACVNLAKGDCKKMEKCFDYRGSCDKDYKAKCEGAVAVSCDLIDGKAYGLNCGLANYKCGIKTGQTATASCTPGPCQSSYSPKCDGFRLLSCAGGLIEVRDCKAESKFCYVPDRGSPTCRGNQRTSCSTKSGFRPKCEGNVAVSCVEGREHWEWCDRSDLLPGACKDGLCTDTGTECTVGALDKCLGDYLQVCIDGTWRTIDCEKLGLGKCKPKGLIANCSRPIM
jgi:hypothetical protein